MHCLILGDINHYFTSFLKVGLAGHELELQQKKQSCLAESNPSTYTFSILGCPRKRKNEDDNDSEKISGPKKQHLAKASLAQIQPPTSQRHKCSSDGSQTKNDQTVKTNKTKSSRTSNSTYSLRSQITTSTRLRLLPFRHDSISLVPSDDNLDLNQIGDETPRLKKDELEVLQKVITQTKFPSWFSCLPRKFDFKSIQTLKEAECKILMTFYLPLALVPIGSLQISHREERVNRPGNSLHKDLLLKSPI
ncbi:hypothetical protein O181_019774 [Austropuccinia psidii MF-1]|uniref:Uncharacterized protein n=1 Tax=Austropuccinia psidii MF-1 TaxID=1389203 RepID=A0A9Q3C7Q6_9BASI|nr:hypothetical protein [Austropuccinia psidii MF-1]